MFAVCWYLSQTSGTGNVWLCRTGAEDSYRREGRVVTKTVCLTSRQRWQRCLKCSLCMQVTVYRAVHVGIVFVYTYFLVYFLCACLCTRRYAFCLNPFGCASLSAARGRVCACVLMSSLWGPLCLWQPHSGKTSQPDNLWQRFKAKLHPQLMNY